jgi:hypothetical protein
MRSRPAEYNGGFVQRASAFSLGVHLFAICAPELRGPKPQLLDRAQRLLKKSRKIGKMSNSGIRFQKNWSIHYSPLCSKTLRPR